jgi:CRISPR/Cas system-associated exonuclease Cas4 (RecB family)
MSAHVLIDDQPVSGCRNIVDEIKELLADKFNVLHSTIQLECDKCELGQVCSLPSSVRKEIEKESGTH